MFAPWMWQVLLGYLWTAELPPTPASGDKFAGDKHTHTHRRTHSGYCQGCWDVAGSLWMFSVLSGHNVQPHTDSGPKVMEGRCTTAENHLPDLWSDLENPLGTLWQTQSCISQCFEPIVSLLDCRWDLRETCYLYSFYPHQPPSL